jgi:small subunit ribosomal protein S1
LELPYGIEGFCSAKNLVKKMAVRLKQVITWISKCLSSRRKIAESCFHTKPCKAEEAPVAKKAAPAAKAASKGKTIDKINQEVEKSTLGDLEALSALKDKMSAQKESNSFSSIDDKKVALIRPPFVFK